jgi:hypothetical protein
LLLPWSALFIGTPMQLGADIMVKQHIIVVVMYQCIIVIILPGEVERKKRKEQLVEK